MFVLTFLEFFVFTVVDIIDPPPPEQNVERNQNITLTCRASSNTNVTIVWMIGDKMISEIDGRVSIVTNGFNSTLIIANAQPSDEGFYSCNATSPETGLSDVSTPSKVSVNCKLTVVFDVGSLNINTY